MAYIEKIKLVDLLAKVRRESSLGDLRVIVEDCNLASLARQIGNVQFGLTNNGWQPGTQISIDKPVLFSIHYGEYTLRETILSISGEPGFRLGGRIDNSSLGAMSYNEERRCLTIPVIEPNGYEIRLRAKE